MRMVERKGGKSGKSGNRLKLLTLPKGLYKFFWLHAENALEALFGSLVRFAPARLPFAKFGVVAIIVETPQMLSFDFFASLSCAASQEIIDTLPSLGTVDSIAESSFLLRNGNVQLIGFL